MSLAKRAGQRRGWQTVEVRTTTGRGGDQAVQDVPGDLAAGRGRDPGGDRQGGRRPWRAYFCTDPAASVEAIVQAMPDRWAIEQNFHDLKEVERIGQVQLRRVWSNVGAFNLSLWVHTLVEVWAWDRPAAS